MPDRDALSESERIDRLARALCSVNFGPRKERYWDDLDERERERFRAEARVALDIADSTSSVGPAVHPQEAIVSETQQEEAPEQEQPEEEEGDEEAEDEASE